MTLGIVISTAGFAFIDGKLRDGLRAYYVLDSPSAGDYAKWADSDTPGAAAIFTSFYVYDIVNPWEVSVLGAKPNVTEIGPLKYVYKYKKFNVTWDDGEDGDMLTFNQWQYYVAADDRTRELEKRVVTTVYAPLLGALSNPLARLLLQLLPEYSSPMALWTNRSVYETIWGWEKDPLLTLLAGSMPGLPTTYPGLQSNDSSIDESLAVHGPSRMYTGAVTGELSRELATWDGMDTMMCCPYGPCGDTGSGGNTSTGPVAPWRTDAAQQIQGSFGDQFKQFVDPSDVLRVGSYGFGIYRWVVNRGSTRRSVCAISTTGPASRLPAHQCPLRHV